MRSVKSEILERLYRALYGSITAQIDRVRAGGVCSYSVGLFGKIGSSPSLWRMSETNPF